MESRPATPIACDAAATTVRASWAAAVAGSDRTSSTQAQTFPTRAWGAETRPGRPSEVLCIFVGGARDRLPGSNGLSRPEPPRGTVAYPNTGPAPVRRPG